MHGHATWRCARAPCTAQRIATRAMHPNRAKLKLNNKVATAALLQP